MENTEPKKKKDTGWAFSALGKTLGTLIADGPEAALKVAKEKIDDVGADVKGGVRKLLDEADAAEKREGTIETDGTAVEESTP